MLKYYELQSIFTLLRKGLSVPNIAAKIGRSTTTIYKYLRDGGVKKDQVKETHLPRKLLHYKEYLDLRLKHGVINSTKLYSELKEKGFVGGHASVNRYVKDKISAPGRYKPSKHVNERKPGEQAQVDWASFGKIEINGAIQRLYAFVYILSYSRAIFVEFVIKQDQQTFQRCHIHVFEKLGFPEKILYDNIKTVVLQREKLPDDRVKIHFNPAFLDFSQYYGFQACLCPPYWPRSKGKVEAGVKYVRNNFMNGMVFQINFSSLRDLNLQVSSWVVSVAHQRIHGSTNEKPEDLWRKEKPFLRFPTKFSQYETSPFVKRNATKDGWVQYRSSFYSIPVQYARKQLFLKELSKDGVPAIEIYFQDEMIATHYASQKKGAWVMDDTHFMQLIPANKRNEMNTSSLRQIHKNKYPIVVNRDLTYYDRLIVSTIHGKSKS